MVEVVGDYVFGTVHILGHSVQIHSRTPASKNVPSLWLRFSENHDVQSYHGADSILSPAGCLVSQSESVVPLHTPHTCDTELHPTKTLLQSRVS